MEIIFSYKAKKDLEFWSKSGNKQIIKKLSELIKVIKENPYSGVGKPEPLKHNLSGVWSRRINQKDRVIYYLENDTITVYVISAIGHCNDK